MGYAWETLAGIVAVVLVFVLLWLYAKACDRL